MRNRLNELLPGVAGISANVVIETSLAGAAEMLLTRCGFAGKKLLLVCDPFTYEALGKRVEEELNSLEPEILKLPGDVHADEVALELIRSKKADALIGIGSGTINDLCKYASFLDDKRYAVFPTAPSMNGYLSANASITLDGVKETKKAHLPAGVFCDLQIIAAAPKRLICSGLGDSLCRSTAQVDWLLSHLLLDTHYDSRPFDLLKPYEAELFAHADKLLKDDTLTIELLVKTLLISGLGMTLAGGSYPASQGEHMIAHTMEMRHGGNLSDAFHGEQIGVTTLTMARIQQEILSSPLILPSEPPWEAALAGYFGRKQARLVAHGSYKKFELYERYDALAAKLKNDSKEIAKALLEVSLAESTLQEVLLKAGAPTTAAALGWNPVDYDAAVAHARYTRDRFTFLDLLSSQQVVW